MRIYITISRQICTLKREAGAIIGWALGGEQFTSAIPVGNPFPPSTGKIILDLKHPPETNHACDPGWEKGNIWTREKLT